LPAAKIALPQDTQSGALQDPAILTDTCRGGDDEHDDDGNSHGHGHD
jgi:hypothetical protein